MLRTSVWWSSFCQTGMTSCWIVAVHCKMLGSSSTKSDSTFATSTWFRNLTEKPSHSHTCSRVRLLRKRLRPSPWVMATTHGTCASTMDSFSRAVWTLIMHDSVNSPRDLSSHVPFEPLLNCYTESDFFRNWLFDFSINNINPADKTQNLPTFSNTFMYQPSTYVCKLSNPLKPRTTYLGLADFLMRHSIYDYIAVSIIYTSN